jgi:hypothetical protein
MTTDHPTDAFAAWATFRRLMRDDPEYAWAWHCNIAVPIMDAIGVSHEQANVAAAHLMSCLFEYDITTHPNYTYEKGGAQSYHEARIAADKDEDAALVEVERDADGNPMICTGYGTVETIASIKARKKSAFSCCPERKMVRARATGATS